MVTRANTCRNRTIKGFLWLVLKNKHVLVVHLLFDFGSFPNLGCRFQYEEVSSVAMET